MRSCLVWFIYWLIWPIFFGYGQKFQYVIYEGEDYPFKQVNGVAEDIHSYIWLATDQGLFRFDGTNFEDFNTTLESRYIRCVIPINEDEILFSNDTGVHRLFYQDDQVVVEPYLSMNAKAGELEYPKNLLMDANRRLWIGQLDGSVLRYEKDTGTTMSFRLTSQAKTPDILLGQDSFKTVWAFIPKQGLYYFDNEDQRFKEKGSFRDYCHFQVLDDKLLLAGRQLIQLRIGEDQALEDRKVLHANGPEFSYLNIDKSGLIFLASIEGLFSLNIEDDGPLRQIYGSNDPHRVEQLPFSHINQIYFSKDQLRPGGKIWISSDKGLGLLYTGFFGSVSGLPMDNTISLGLSSDNQVLISQGNIFMVDEVDREDSFEEFETEDTRITAITNTRRRHVWLGNSEGMAIRAENRSLREFDFSERGGGIFYMFEDSYGYIWFCQAPADTPIVGVAKLNQEGEMEEYGREKGLNSRVLVVDEGGESELYAAGIGTESYLYKYNRELDRFENKSLPFPFKISRNFEVHDISVDARGMVWMATTDGLLKYDTERIQRIDLGSLTKNEIRSVVSMPGGSIWMATATRGMIHLDKQGKYVLFDERSGTPSNIASYRAMLLDNENRLWTGTAEGAVYSVMPYPAPLSTRTPSLNRVQLNAEDLKPDSTLEFSRDDIVDFHFTSISFPGDENQFRYKYYKSDLPIEEIEDISWVQGDQSSRIRVSAPNAGNYILQVCAQKPGGYDWSLPAEVNFMVLRPWYLSWWGIGIIFLLGILIVRSVIRIYSRKRTAQLESLLSTKEKELTAKQELLLSREDEMKHQRDALKSAGVSIYLLHRLLRQIPRRSRWSKVIPVLSKLVELPTGMDAFELAFLANHTVQYLGYKRGSDKIQQREVEFNEKENLTSYVLSHKKPLLIKNNEKEFAQYISQTDNRGYLSRIYIPFEQNKGAEAVLCVYGEDMNRFSRQDLTILQILGTFLSANVTDELK